MSEWMTMDKAMIKVEEKELSVTRVKVCMLYTLPDLHND